MTYSSSSGAVASNKPNFLSATTSPIAITSGLVQHDLVSPTDQVVILSMIEESGSASVGDVMVALDGHDDPAGAIQVLITAGVVSADDPPPSAPGGVLPTAGGLPDDAVSLCVTSMQPSVVVSPGRARRAMGRAEVLHRPGVYILLSGAQAYVGMGSEVGRRVATGSQPIADVDAIITITDAHDGLSETDALVLVSSIAAFRRRGKSHW
jgi:hypothetical protein